MSVFNPDLESDGWQSTHTVIFILHPNMPFLIDSLRIAINQREIGTHSIQHSILQVERDTQGKLKNCILRKRSPPMPATRRSLCWRLTGIAARKT